MKIVLAGAHQGPAVEARAAAQNASHIEASGFAVDVDLAVVVRPFVNQHRLLVVRRAVCDVASTPFEDQDRLSRFRTCISKGGPAGTAAENDHVAIVIQSGLLRHVAA